MLPSQVTLAPKDVSNGAMRAIAKILSQRGGDLEQRLRGAIRDIASAPEDVAVAAFCHLLADLVHHRWDIKPVGDLIQVSAPQALNAVSEEPPQALKRRRREYNARSRQKQLAEPPVREFLRKMETPRVHAKRRVSIRDIIDDGHSLAVALADANRLPPMERRAALEAIVQPTIEVATAKAYCEHTGLPLLEIWRYFRHTWSLEYRSTPGRSLHLLVRNAARPNAPVIGIASLANATLQQSDRDMWIGWHIDAIRDDLAAHPERWEEHRACFLEVIKAATAEIYTDDLTARLRGAKGEALEARLREIAEMAAQARELHLRGRQLRCTAGKELASLRALPMTDDGDVDWRAAAEQPLYVAKRARTLADLLFAARVLQRIPSGGNEPTARGARDEEFARALTIAAREVRKIGLASRLLELNVCGAVPPYRDLLGGKLVAVAVACEEVSQALAKRYGGQVSEIASQMAGRPVTRDPSLCVLMTQSLYGKSSQYNRIRLRTGEHGVLRWMEIGETKGLGTSHLSPETTAALRNFSVYKEKGRLMNNVFGEGQSPLLRQVREGLERLGLPTGDILKHGVNRRIYGLELFEGAREHLQLNKAHERRLAPLAVIAAAWRERWLSPRIGRREVLDRVAREGFETVRADLAAEGDQQNLFSPPAPPGVPQ